MRRSRARDGARLVWAARVARELRVACGVSRDGSKASNMLRAAGHYGLIARGYRREPTDLDQLPLPLIIHWNFNHFLVYEGAPPRPGLPERSSWRSEDRVGDRVRSGVHWRGTHVRAPDPTSNGAVSGGDWFQRCVRGWLGRTPALVFVFGAGLLLVAPGLVAPTFTRLFVDDILVRGAIDLGKPLFLVMGVTVGVIGALSWLQHYALLRLETKFAVSTSGRFLWHVMHLPMQFFTQRFAGDIGSRVAINDRIAYLLSGELATSFIGACLAVFYAALMWQYDHLLSLIALGTAGLNALALKYFSARRVHLNQQLLHDQSRMLGTAMGGLQSVETLKAMGAESDLFAKWSGYQAKAVGTEQRLRVQTELLSAVPRLLMPVSTACILGIGGLRVMDGGISMGMLIAFQVLMLGFITPVNRMVDLGSTLQEVKGDLARLDDVLAAGTDVGAIESEGPAASGARNGKPLSPTPVRLSGYLELRDVSFGYSPLEPPLIEGFNLTLDPGQRVALVGGSGCGKTTIARLVCRPVPAMEWRRPVRRPAETGGAAPAPDRVVRRR